MPKFLEKIGRGYPYWSTFVTTLRVEPTNNTTERGSGSLLVQRKITRTLRNRKGAYIYETLTTLLATRKQRGLDLTETMSESLSRAWTKANTKPG